MKVGVRRSVVRRVMLCTVAVGLVATVLAVVPVTPAGATETDPVLASFAFDLEGFQDMLLVESTDRLFITGGETDDTLLVTDLVGNEISRTTGLAGVRQMAYDPVNNWVWIAVADGAAVRAHDAGTGAFARRVSLPAGMCPSAIALAGGADVTVGNETLVVSSECDDRLVVLDLADFTVDVHSGYPDVLQLAPSPPPEQPGRVVMLDETAVRVLSFQATPTELYSLAVSATTIATSSKGPRRIAIGTGTDVNTLSYPTLVVEDTFALDMEPIALEWTRQPAVVSVDLEQVVGLRPSTSGAFWGFPVAPAIPYPNGIQAHSDGRIFIAAELPPDPGGGGDPDPGGGGGDPGGGGGGVITPGEGENPASLSGTVTGTAPAAAGHVPATLEVRLLDDEHDVVAVDSVTFGSGAYSFTTVQPGTYYLEFHALTDGATEGFFGERHSDRRLLAKTTSTAVVLSSDEDAVVNAVLSPLFYDMFGSVFYADILWMGNTGITQGCNPPTNTLYCGADAVTRGQMAAFLVRALGLTATGTIDFVDDNGSIFEADIEKLAAAGITKGCNPPSNTKFCPDSPVTRGQMAAFLVRALALTATGSVDFVDDNGSVFEADIEKLATAGITLGCNPPANSKFCPDALVTRGQLAAFLNRAVADLWPSG